MCVGDGGGGKRTCSRLKQIYIIRACSQITMKSINCSNKKNLTFYSVFILFVIISIEVGYWLVFHPWISKKGNLLYERILYDDTLCTCVWTIWFFLSLLFLIASFITFLYAIYMLAFNRFHSRFQALACFWSYFVGFCFQLENVPVSEILDMNLQQRNEIKKAK